MPVDSAARPRMSPAVLVMMLTLLPGIRPVTTDLYLPALPTLTLALNTGVAAAQATLVAVAGPGAERHGVPAELGPGRIQHRRGRGGVHPVQQHGEAPAAFNPGLQHSSV